MEVKLLFRMPPRSDESLVSYLRRLSEAHHYPSPRWVTTLAGNQHDSPYVPEDTFIEALARLTDQPADMLRSLTLHRFAPVLNPLGLSSTALSHTAVVRYVHHRRSGLRYCPQCFAEDPYLRLMWQLRPITACCRHRRLLVESCPSCHKPVSARGVWTGQCVCGQSLWQIQGMQLPQEAEGMRTLHIIRESLEPADVALEKMTPSTWFASVDFLQRWYSSFPPGFLSVDGVSTQPCRSKKFWRPVESDYVHYTLAVRLLREGRECFAEMCRLWLEVNRKNGLGLGFHQHFRRMAQLLQEFPRPEFDHLHDWLCTYLADEWVGGYPSRLSSFGAESKQRITFREAGALLSSRTQQVALLVKNGVLRGNLMPLTPEGKLCGLVEKSSAVALVAKRSESMLCEEASFRLGLHPETVSELCRLRVLQSVSGPTADGEETISIHPAELARLMHALKEKSVSMSDGMESLRDLNPVDAGAALSDVLLDRRSVHIVTDGLRIETCSIGPKDDNHQSQSPELIRDGVEATAFCADTMISPGVLLVLVNHGLLELKDGFVYGVPQFLAEHIWENDAAHVLGMTSAALRRWVRNDRLQPALQVGATYLFRRPQVLKLGLLNRCSVKEAVRILGLRHTQDLHRQYLQRGRLTPIGGPGIDGCRDYLFDRQHVLHLARGGLPDRLTVREAARMMQVNYYTLLRWIREKKIPAQMGQANRLRPHYFVDRTVVEDLIGDQEQRCNLRRPTTPFGWDHPQDEKDDHLLTTTEAAAMLGISVETFQARYRRTDRLQPCALHKMGGQHLYRQSHVQSLREPREA